MVCLLPILISQDLCVCDPVLLFDVGKDWPSQCVLCDKKV